MVQWERWAVGTLKAPSLTVSVLGKKFTDVAGIRYYFKKRSVVCRYSVPVLFVQKNAAVNAIFAAIMPPVKVTPAQNICDVNRLQFYLSLLD